MRKIEHSANAVRQMPGRTSERRVVRPAVLAFAGAIWLGACAPTGGGSPPPLAGPSAPVAVEPSAEPSAAPNAPISAEPSAGPIALAPSMTGPPVRAPAPPPAPPPAAAPPEPPPALAAVASEPPPPPAASAAPAAPSPCPPGQIAAWSKPDMAGAPVLFCRRLYP